MKRFMATIIVAVFLFASGCAHKQKVASRVPYTKERLAIIHEVMAATGKVVNLLDDKTIPVEKRMEMYKALMEALNEILYRIK